MQISGRRCGRIVSCECGGLCRFHGARCGSLGCGLCKILRGLCNLPGADHPGGHAELQQPVPTTDANRPIQHSRLRHAGMPPVRPARGLALHVILDRPSKRFTSQPALTRIRQVIARQGFPVDPKRFPACMRARETSLDQSLSILPARASETTDGQILVLTASRLQVIRLLHEQESSCARNPKMPHSQGESNRFQQVRAWFQLVISMPDTRQNGTL